MRRTESLFRRYSLARRTLRGVLWFVYCGVILSAVRFVRTATRRVGPTAGGGPCVYVTAMTADYPAGPGQRDGDDTTTTVPKTTTTTTPPYLELDSEMGKP